MTEAAGKRVCYRPAIYMAEDQRRRRAYFSLLLLH